MGTVSYTHLDVYKRQLLKYEEVTRLGDWFAARLAEVVARQPAEFRADVVVPVPLHADRFRERGYNQADLIARPLAHRLGLKRGSYLLMRIKPRPARLVLSRKEHWDSVRGAYATREGVRVDKLRILLIDDVSVSYTHLDVYKRQGWQSPEHASLRFCLCAPGCWATSPSHPSLQIRTLPRV